MGALKKLFKSITNRTHNLFGLMSGIIVTCLISAKMIEVAHPKALSHSAFSVLAGVDYLQLILFFLLSGYFFFFWFSIIFIILVKLKLIKGSSVGVPNIMDLVFLSAFLSSTSLYLTENQFNLVVSAASLVVIVIKFKPFKKIDPKIQPPDQPPTESD